MKFKVFDKRANKGNYYDNYFMFESMEEFHKYQLVVWSCDHELVLLGTNDNTLTFERREK